MKMNNFNLVKSLKVLFILLIMTSLFFVLNGQIDYRDIDSIEKYKIHLEVSYLPFYVCLSLIRMFIALILSNIIAIWIGRKMANNVVWSRYGLIVIDILQSIPLEGFLTFSTAFFISLHPHSILSAQVSVIFAFILSQVWNLILSAYESFSEVKRYRQIIKQYNLPSSYVFWKVEIPSILPRLLWNDMLSLSASWFIIGSSEYLTLRNNINSRVEFALPGLGGLIKQASLVGNLQVLIYSLMAIALTIILYNVLIFNKTLPALLVKNVSMLVLLNMYYDEWNRAIRKYLQRYFLQIKFLISYPRNILKKIPFNLLNLFLFILPFRFYFYFGKNIILEILPRLIVTTLRILISLFLVTLMGVPLGIFLGTRKKSLFFIQWSIQIISSIPIIIYYPLVFKLYSVCRVPFDIICTLFITLISFWCVLFNVIAGMSNIPSSYSKLAKQLNLSSRTFFFKIVLPSIAPSYMTGIISASGAAWNASVICEYMVWNKQILQVYGIGSYIYLNSGMYKEILCSVILMSISILLINNYLWHPALKLMKQKFTRENNEHSYLLK